MASFNTQSAVTACPSGWTKSADGLTCVLETKTTQTPNQVSNTTKPVCISGFTYSSTSMKCEQITIASQFTKYKDYEFTGGLNFGSDPVNEEITVSQSSCPFGYSLVKSDYIFLYNTPHLNNVGNGITQSYTVPETAFYSIRVDIDDHNPYNITSYIDLGIYSAGSKITTKSSEWSWDNGIINECLSNRMNGDGSYGVFLTSRPGPSQCLYGIYNSSRGYDFLVYKKVLTCKSN